MILVSSERLSLLISKKKILAVDWDSCTLRMILFNPDLTAPKVIKVISEKIASDVDVNEADSFGRFIGTILAKHNVKVSASIFGIGRERAFLHHLEVPACPENQLANLVRFQLAQELPFAIEEAVVDYVITARNEQNYVTNVLACAVRAETVDRLMRIAKGANLKLVKIGLRPYANYLTVKGLGELSDDMSLFVDNRPNEIEIDAFTKSGLIFSRSVGLSDTSVDSKMNVDSDADDKLLENVMLQLRRIIRICNADPNLKIPNRILISGSVGNESELSERVSEEFNVSSELVELPIELGEHGAESLGSWAFVSLLGLAIGYSLPASTNFDFVNPKRSVDPQAIRSRQIRLAVAAIALIMILGIVYSHRLISDKKYEYAKLKLSDKKKAKQLRAFKKFENQIYGIEEWQERKRSWFGEFVARIGWIPEKRKAYVRSVFLGEKKKPGMLGQIVIDGQAVSSRVVDEILQRLDKSGRYCEIRPGKQIPRSQASRYPESFKIRLSIAKRKQRRSDVKSKKLNDVKFKKLNESDSDKVK